ncbi:MAG TPA: cyclic nucleotide-binding and patatin-like phospholipase domain-containing protein [Ktedonobacteraceae bacterium]|nr:cyclic nucleotide-binding and patatin-like phospholipase domain-containing protein [Ktedonobacteraceae bacterium]
MQEDREPQQLMKASALFRDLEPHEASAIAARLRSARYARGEHVLERGVWRGQLYIIAAGRVSVVLQERQDMEPVVVASLGPGECFGEMSLITGESPTATIRVEQDTLLWSLQQADFLALVGSCPTLLRNINTILSQRLARMNQRMLARQRGELLWFSLSSADNTPARRSLALHIADALTQRWQMRVLLLALDEQVRAIAEGFAVDPGQLRPSLLDIAVDPSLLQAHAVPAIALDGRRYAALASFSAAQAQASTTDSDVLAVLHDLSLHYDYLLLVSSEQPLAETVQAMVGVCSRSIVLVAADALEAFPGMSADVAGERAVFVTHVTERPTIGAQDRYSAQLGCPVTRLLPADMPLLERCWQERKTLWQTAPAAELSRAVDFVARFIAGRTVGIAFGGGGARGFAHIGVLDRLLHHDVPLDYVTACSSGMIAAGMYLFGRPLEEIESKFLEIQRNIIRWHIPRTSLFSNKGLIRMIRNLTGDARFEDLTTPFALVAVDLATRAGVVLDRGPLWQAGLASVALPGIFPPVMVGKHILMDAGFHDPVPVRLLRQMGADILLASELSGQEPPALARATPWLEEQHYLHREKAPYILDILLRSYDLAMATVGMHSIKEADIVIRPSLHRVSLRQFSEGHKFIDAGRAAVEQSLPALSKYLPWIQ